MAKKIPMFKTWRKVTIVTGLRTYGNYVKALEEMNVLVNNEAKSLLRHYDSPSQSSMIGNKIFELAVVSLADLGFRKSQHIFRIYERARKCGLGLCPSEIGPQLRLQYKDQPRSSMLLIGMKPIETTPNDFAIFSVETNFYCRPGLVGGIQQEKFELDSRWVFLQQGQGSY